MLRGIPLVYLLEWFGLAMTGLLVVTQLVIPFVLWTPFFPMFPTRATTLSRQLAQLRQEVKDADIEEEISRLTSELEKRRTMRARKEQAEQAERQPTDPKGA